MNQLWLDNKFMNLKLIDGSIMGLAGWAMTLGKKKDTFVIWEIIAQRSNPPHKPQLLCTGDANHQAQRKKQQIQQWR